MAYHYQDHCNILWDNLLWGYHTTEIPPNPIVILSCCELCYRPKKWAICIWVNSSDKSFSLAVLVCLFSTYRVLHYHLDPW